MRVDLTRAFGARALAVLLAMLALLGLSFAANAQEDGDGGADEGDDAEQAREAPVEEVVVTGSRLSRNTYTSISPLQVISGQVSREIGLIDAGTILQESSAASGVQIDLTFQGFVLDNGPGATTIDLRGLGADRTLVLIDGRRVSPAGVEGAPVSPDTNLIPSTLVQQYEVLLDGASSVYGSDAVAGVVNVIMRKDFEGLELEAFTSFPAGEYSAGRQNALSAAWGYNGDRGFIGVGAEYVSLEPVTFADRKWTDECDKHYEVTEDGEVRNQDIWYEVNLDMRPSDCRADGLSGRFAELGGGFGSVYYTPGASNTGIPNFSEGAIFNVPVSYGADGYNSVSYIDYASNGNTQFTQIIPDIDTVSGMAYGEYTFSGEANITPYFEVLYARRDTFQDAGAYQLFPTVPADNPFNPCNPNAAGGVDCAAAWNNVLTEPDFVSRFTDFYGAAPADFGLLYDPADLGFALPVQPIVNVRGDRTLADVTIDQLRAVAGVRGDLPWLSFGSVDNWQFDAYVLQSNSEGTSSRPGIREDRLDYALGWYSATTTPCQNDTGAALPDDQTLNCVPVNLFAPSLYSPVIGGDFATAAERNYLFDTRDFNTQYKQSIFSLYANGEVFPMPGGAALFGIGAEYRQDEIDSIPDDVARDGLFFGFFSDGGAVGEKDTKEGFAELELPLLAGVTGFQELTANVSTRYTEDEFYEGSWTYSGKLAWRPVDSLLLRGTIGTSYRAPNLRENFLQAQTGFLNLFDPCIVPDAAYNDVTNTYDPSQDDREPQVLANCQAQGIDPTSLYIPGGISIYSTEVAAGGSLTLEEESSETFSAGFVWEQPFFTAFDLVFGATYYEIDIQDEIIEPSAQFIINDCYDDPQGDSTFCDRIQRDGDGFLELVDQGFINRDQKKARGVDLNMTVDWPTQIFGKAVDLQADLAFNRQLENRDIFVGDAGDVSEDDYVGEFGYPEWKGRSTFRADVGNWRYTWAMRYISSVAEDPAEVDEFSDVIEGGSDTCGGPLLGDVQCRDLGYADNYFVHDASVYFYGDVWTIGAGLRNVFNEAPPLVDGDEVFSFNNVPYGAGYDVFGRTLFANVVYNWE
jgi:iron complex outermembrane recepter protein